VTTGREGFVHVAHSTHPVAAVAVGEIAAELIERDAVRPDLLLVFTTNAFAGALEDIAPALRRLLSPTTLAGCAAEQVLAPDGWIIDGPAISVMAINQGEVEAVRYSSEVSIETSDESTYVLFADPFTVNVSLLSTVCGGYAATGAGPGTTRLVLDDEVFTHGAVGIRIPPQRPIRTFADDSLLDTAAWTEGVAVLAFQELDFEVWNETRSGQQKIDDEEHESAPVVCGFVSKRTFPLSLTVFGAQNAREQGNKEP
jgi:hypothetical protein